MQDLATERLSLQAGTLSRANSALRVCLDFCRKKPLGGAGAVVVILLFVSAAFAPWIAPYDPHEHDRPNRLASPTLDHPVGTDQLGRDVLSRLIFGARVSLAVALAATIGSLIPTLFIGVTSAYFGGWYDYVTQRVVDAFYALPGLILLIAIVSVLGASLLNVMLALAVLGGTSGSRVIRGATMKVQSEAYIDAARSMGATNLRIIVRHILPNLVPILIVTNSLALGGYIIAEASLSFLGLGVPPPAPTWGGMLAADGRQYMYVAWWMFVGPAVALSVVVFGVNMFGDALRDVLDPRMRGSR